MARLPFARLNLRHNPFGEATDEERGDLFVGGLEDWPSFFSGSRGVLQFLGPSGCGKSVFLRALQARFPGSGLFAWSAVEGWPELPTPGDHPLFVDDAQELDGPLLDRVLQFPMVAVATQEDLAVSFRRAGFVVRTVRVPDLVSFSHLEEMAARRLEWARRGPGPIPSVEGEVLRSLLRQHGHDLRAIQSHLYDWYQQLEAGE